MEINPVLVGLGHKARQGKSQFKDAILAWCASRCITAKNYSFGQTVLDFCQLEGYIPPGLRREELKEEHLATLQSVGLQKREEDDKFWIKRLEASMRDDAPTVMVMTVDNVRYKNEASWFRKLEGFRTALVKIVRFVGGKPYISPDRDPKHPSEVDLDGVSWNSYFVRNDHGIRWLNLQAEALIQHLVLQ